MNGVQTRFKCKLDVKRCKRFVFPPSSLLPRSNALKTKAIRYFQTDRTLTRIVSPPLPGKTADGLSGYCHSCGICRIHLTPSCQNGYAGTERRNGGSDTAFCPGGAGSERRNIEKVEPIAPPPPALKSTIKFTAPVIKKDEEVHDDDELKSQDELTETKVQISIADVKGNDELNGKDIADLQEVITQAPEAQEEEPYMMVEQMPQFPGGPAELLKYIAKNLKYPVIAQENGIQGKVILRFVVNAQGHVENVKVLRSLDPYCDKEAIRVVKSLPQWIPGKQNGRNVPVYYTCPIVLNYSNHQVYEKEINAISVVHAHVLGL